MDFEVFLAGPDDSILVEIVRTRGSTPREAGAFMLVAATGSWGTIGGGRMEFDAIETARAMLRDGRQNAGLEIVLGPETGQCCGGRVELALSRVTPSVRDALSQRLGRAASDNPDIFIYGAGHVGRALAVALRPLPFRVTVIETRAEELEQLPGDIARRLEAMPEATVADIRPGGAAVIMNHDHALDFLIGAEALKRADLRYVGMIGSKTKRGVFASWLTDAGHSAQLLERLVLPIGDRGVRDKRPAVIAALVAAELVERLSAP